MFENAKEALRAWIRPTSTHLAALRGDLQSRLRHFKADDWLAIDAITARVQHDPLLPTSTEDRFAQLRRVIAAEAGCGCEPEPAPGEFARPGA